MRKGLNYRSPSMKLQEGAAPVFSASMAEVPWLSSFTLPILVHIPVSVPLPYSLHQSYPLKRTK